MTYQLPEPDCGVHYTAAQLREAYAHGQRDMREAAEVLVESMYVEASDIRALPIGEVK